MLALGYGHVVVTTQMIQKWAFKVCSLLNIKNDTIAKFLIHIIAGGATPASGGNLTWAFILSCWWQCGYRSIRVNQFVATRLYESFAIVGAEALTWCYRMMNLLAFRSHCDWIDFDVYSSQVIDFAVIECTMVTPLDE